MDTNTACTGTNFIFTAAYLGSFDPNNICTNWIGDSGSSPNPDQPFQVNVDNGQTLVVVVSEVTPDAGCPGYTVTLDNICGGRGSPTPDANAYLPAARRQPGPWTAANPYPTTIVRYGFAQTATDFYVFGGVTTASPRTPSISITSPQEPGHRSHRCHLAMKRLPVRSMKVEASSIARTVAARNRFAAYNIASDSWTSLASDPFVTDHYGSASGAFNGKVFVAGGTTGFSNQLDIYNVATNTWSAGTPAPDRPLPAGRLSSDRSIPVRSGRLRPGCAY